MPFMVGPSPIRRTLKYLEAGKLYFKDRVKVFSVNFNLKGEHHDGARNFVFWNLPQVQYKNPDVQIITFKNMTPTPFITCYFDDEEKMLIDIDSKTKEEIMDHLIAVVGKTRVQLEKEAQTLIDNPANFGYKCERHCICEIIGQVTCPRIIPLPHHMRGKYKHKQD